MGNRLIKGAVLLFFMLQLAVFPQKKLIDSLYARMAVTSQTDSLIEIYLDLSGLLNYDSTEKSIQFAQDALRLSKETGNYMLAVDALNQLATARMAGDIMEGVVAPLNEALRLSVANNYKRGEALSCNHLGMYYYTRSITDSASYFFLRSVRIFKELNIPKKMAKVYNNVGAIYYKQSQYDSALKYFLTSLKIKEQILPSGERVATDKELAASLINIGAFYYKLEKYPEALKYLKKAAEFSEKADYNNYLSIALNNIASIFNTMDQYDSAIYYHYLNGELAKKLNSKKMYSRFYTGLANVYQKTGDYDSSIYYFSKSIMVNKQLQDVDGLSIAQSDLAELYNKLNRFDSAMVYNERALQSARESGDLEIEKKSYEALSKLYKRKNDYQKAYEYEKLYAEISDSINSMNSEKLIVEMQTKYETEKKNTQIQKLKIENLQSENEKNIFRLISISLLIIALLLIVFIWQRVRMNKILKEKNEELHRLNDTQNRLMSIISHDLKSPLSAFFTITNALKNKWEKISRDEIEKYLGSMLNSSIALKLQLENMLNWAINQKREIHVNKSRINLYVIVVKVIMVLQEFAREKNIVIENNIPEDLEINTDGKLMGIAFNNLISNAVKFSNPDSKVIVSAEKKNGKILIFVKDFGEGMSPEQVEHLFTGDQIALRHKNSGTGLGLIVVRDIINKLGGKISVESEPGKGTLFTIEL